MRESQLHKAVADFLSVALEPPTFWTTFPAGGGGLIRGRQLKRAGLKAGFPDLLIIHDGKTFGIELKAPQKYPTPEQRAVHQELRRAGCEVFVARSVMEVTLALETWAIPMRGMVDTSFAERLKRSREAKERQRELINGVPAHPATPESEADPANPNNPGAA